MKVRILILLFILTCFAVVNGQTTVKCAFSTMPGDVTIAKMLPKTGTVKMLVVYCKFKDDTFDSPLTAQWPSNMSTLPVWTSKTISETKMDDYPDPSISGYFKEMSGGMNDNDGDGLPDGKLDVIGSVCPILYIPKNNSSYYTTTQGRNISYLAKEVLDGIDPYINFADYDNDKDGYVDMIAICFRSAPTGEMDPSIGKYQGYASLTGSYKNFDDPSSLSELVKDGVRIKADAFGSGTFQQDIYDPDGQISIICHEMGHYLNLSHTDAVHRHGLMDTNRGGSVMNGYERDFLGWVKPVTINSDATVESGNPITLKDALGNNAIYKIRKSDGFYYYIENHEGKSYYEKSWKSNATETNLDELVMPGKGVLILESSIDPLWRSEILDVKVADGLWNWGKNGSLYVYPFERESPNSYSGQSELDLFSIQTIAGTKNHPDYKGVQNNYFTIGYNQVFSPKSNPSVGSKANFAMELIQQYSGGDILTNFYFTNVYSGTPSKPQLLKSVNNSYGQTVLNWYTNTEPDITGYKIYKGSTDGVKPLTYKLIATVSGATTTTWTDDEKTFGNSNWKVYYKISAIDNTGKESAKSDSSYVNAFSSQFTASATLSGKISFESDGNVSSGAELKFTEGTVITMKNGASITINGNLVANGTSSSKITFQRSGTSGSWGNLIFDGYGVNGSTLNYVNLNNGNEIRVMNGAKVTVSNCLLKDFYHGIYIYNSAPEIRNNIIENPYQHAIYGEASGLSPVIVSNKITKTNLSGQGVFLQNRTVPYVAHNQIIGCYYGVYFGGGTHAYFTDKSYNMYNPNNLFTGNNIALCAAYGGIISAGQFGGYNCWYNTIKANNDYDAYACQSGTIIAQRNYWGGTPKTYKDANSTLDVSSPSGTDPWGNYYTLSASPMADNSAASGTTLSKTGPSTTETDSVDLSTGVKFEKEGRLGDAISWYKTLISSVRAKD